MIGRAATRIDIKLEDDIHEYEEFSLAMQQKRDHERIQQLTAIPGAFGLHGIAGGIGGAFTTNQEQIASYSSYYMDKNEPSGRQRKRKSNNNNMTGANPSLYSNPPDGMNDDSMNDSF